MREADNVSDGSGEDVTTINPKDQLEPTVFVIFGGAGDLTWRKLVPALFDLSKDRSMPADFSIIAVDPGITGSMKAQWC
jgi:hypothetical protein